MFNGSTPLYSRSNLQHKLQIPSEINIKTKFCGTTHAENNEDVFIMASLAEKSGRNSEFLGFLCKSKESESAFWKTVQKKKQSCYG